MPFLIPLVVGAGATGYWWWSSAQEKEQPSFSTELFDTIKPLLLILALVFALRWLYQQGSKQNKS